MTQEKKIIYLDNAATTLIKPPIFFESISDKFTKLANSGRGVYKASLDASHDILHTRQLLADFLQLQNIANIIFTPGCTYSINTSLHGFINQSKFKDYKLNILVSPIEHNAVMRLLNYYEKIDKIKIHYLDYDLQNTIDYHELKQYINSNKIDLIILNHASNVTGQIINLDKFFSTINKSIPVLIDAAQSFPYINLNLKDNNISFIALAGHKCLMGPIGTGILYINDNFTDINPLVFGGTGSFSDNYNMPEFLPDKFEAGSINAALISALGASFEYLINSDIKTSLHNQLELTYYFIDWCQSKNNIIEIFGVAKSINFDSYLKNYLPVVSFRVKAIDNSLVVNFLNEKYNICLRSGIHCAALTHKNLNSIETGLIRLSLGHFNTKNDIDALIHALNEFIKTYT